MRSVGIGQTFVFEREIAGASTLAMDAGALFQGTVAGFASSDTIRLISARWDTAAYAATNSASGVLTLSLNGAPQRVDEGELAAMPDAAANVAGVYAALRDDIAGGTSTAANFDHAVKLTRLVADLLASSRTGSRKPAADWPER